jgi:hypothetical protein
MRHGETRARDPCSAPSMPPERVRRWTRTKAGSAEPPARAGRRRRRRSRGPIAAASRAWAPVRVLGVHPSHSTLDAGVLWRTHRCSWGGRTRLGVDSLPTVACRSLHVACCLLFVVRCMLHVVHCMLHVVGWQSPRSAAVGKDSVRTRALLLAATLHVAWRASHDARWRRIASAACRLVRNRLLSVATAPRRRHASPRALRARCSPQRFVRSFRLRTFRRSEVS